MAGYAVKVRGATLPFQAKCRRGIRVPSPNSMHMGNAGRLPEAFRTGNRDAAMRAGRSVRLASRHRLSEHSERGRGRRTI